MTRAARVAGAPLRRHGFYFMAGMGLMIASFASYKESRRRAPVHSRGPGAGPCTRPFAQRGISADLGMRTLAQLNPSTHAPTSARPGFG